MTFYGILEAQVEQIRENPYYQYFIGLPGYRDEILFVPSLLVEFRKRLTDEIGLAKRCYGLGLIKTKLDTTTHSSIALSTLAMYKGDSVVSRRMVRVNMKKFNTTGLRHIIL